MPSSRPAVQISIGIKGFELSPAMYAKIQGMKQLATVGVEVESEASAVHEVRVPVRDHAGRLGPASGQDLTVDVREFARRLMDAPYVSSGPPAQFMPIRRVRVVG